MALEDVMDHLTSHLLHEAFQGALTTSVWPQL